MGKGTPSDCYDQTIGGTALNIFAPAFAVVITWAVQGQGLTTIQIPTWIRITQANFGLEAGNGFLDSLIFKYFYLTTPVAAVLFIIAWIFLYKTRFGLRLRSCGEHPQAADSVGINVYKMRYAGVLISGFLGGVGGIAYTIAVGSGFSASVGGYGFLALAVMGNLSRSSDPHFSSRCSRSLQPIIPRFLSCRSSKE